MSLPNTPKTDRRPTPAAALVVTHLRLKVAPMFAQLAEPGPAIAEMRLLPVQAVDFYAWKKPQ